MPIYEDDIDTLPTAARNGISLPPSSSDLIRYARTDAAKIGIDPDIAERRIRQESGGNSRAVSDKGAFGAAQLMPATARELAGRYGGNPEDPFDNVRLGNRYYKEQYDRYGNDTLAAAAYNAGPGAVDKYGGVPPYRETQDYVSKVARGGVRTGPLTVAASGSGARPARDEFEGLVDAEPTQMDGVAKSTQMKGAAESSATARGTLGAAWDFAKDSVLSTLHLEDGRSDSTGGDWGRALGGQGVGVAIPQTALGVNRWAIGTPSNAIASALVPQVMMDWRDSINDRFSAWLNKRSADLQEQKTPTMQESAKKQYFESSWKDVSENGLSGVPGEVIQRAKDGRLFGSGWSDWRKISDSALQSLPVSLVSMIPATRAAGTAYKGAYAGAINSGATEQAAKAIAVKAAERTAGYMGGAMEGITGAGSQYEQTYQQVMDLPQSKLESSASYEQALKLQPADLAPQERAMRARRTIAHAASSTAAIVAGISDALLGGLGDRYLGSAAAGKDSRLRSVLRGLGQETPTEFGQSGLEQFGTNLGVKSFADPSQSLSDQVGEQAVGGALSGGLMGGGMGGASYHKQGTPAEAQSSGAESPPAVGGAVPASDFLGRPPNPPTSLQPAPAPVSAPVDAAAAALEADPTAVAPSRTLTLTTGAQTTFSTETGVMLEGNYALAEADDLIASHDTNLRPNPAFPVELQPRSRDRAASGLQISQIVQKLNPERLGASPDVANGAPIIGADGLVESGNARTIALRRTYEANGLQAQRYRDWLKASAEQFGITPDAVDAMQKPILVRVRNTPVNRAEFARQANTSTVAAMSATEQAASDVARIGYLDDLQLTEDGDLTGADNRSFVNRFVGGLSPGEQAGMLDAAGRLSQAGVTRIRNAVMARAYGNSPTLMRMVESADANLRNLTNALTRVAPKVAKAREAIAAGALHDADLTSDLLAAVEALVKIKEDGRSVDESLAQMELGGQSLSDETLDLIRFLDQNSRAPRRVAAFISDYFDALASFGNPQQQSLLDDGTIPDMRSLIAQVKERSNATETNTAAAGATAQPGPQGGEQPGSQESGTPSAAEATDWVAFPPDSGTLGIPRAEMPQVKSVDRGALVQFLKGRGITHERVKVDPHTLRPTQAEFSLKKTAKWSEVRADTDRSILISSDGYVLDGHHQWVGALSNGEQEDAIRFNAPIRELIAAVFEFPSVKQSDGGANVIDMASVRQAREAKADQDYEAALADLGTWVRGNLTGTFRMVPEDTPALLKTLTRLFDAAIRKGYYTFSKAVTRVMADLRRSKETAPLVNSVKPQMLQQAYDDALKAYTSERGPDGPQTELFADQKQGETADMFAAPTAKAAERTPTAVTAVPFFMDWIKTQGDTWPVHGERLEKLRDLYAATYPQQITRENGPPIVKKDVAKDEMAPDLPPAAGIVNKIDLSATPEQKVAALVDLAKQNEPIVAAFIAKVDAKYGTASKYSFKEPEKILSKPVRPSILAAKPWYGVEHIRDSFRFKTVLQRYSDLPAIVQTLRTELGAEIVEQDTRKVLAPKEWGWRIVAFDLRMPNGQIIEYYLPIAEQEAYKKAEGHKLFEDWRNKDVNRLTDDEKRQFQAALLMSNEGYQSAWEASIARTGQDEAAIRAFLTQLSASAPSTRLNSSLSSSAENNLPDQTAPSNEPKTPASASSTITRPSSDLDTTGFISTPSAASIDQVGTDKKGVGNENATNGTSGDEGPGAGSASTNGAGGNTAGVRRGTGGPDRQPGGTGRDERPATAQSGQTSVSGTGAGDERNPPGSNGKSPPRKPRVSEPDRAPVIPPKSGTNYRFTDEDLSYTGGWMTKAKQNIAAIEVVQQLDREGRRATPAEQAVLAKYVGWGASELAQNLFSDKLDAKLAAIQQYQDAIEPFTEDPKRQILYRGQSGHWQAATLIAEKTGKPTYDYSLNQITRAQIEAVKPDMSAKRWAELRDNLKLLLSDEEWATASRSTQNAHYTSKDIVRSMWSVMQKFGFKGGSVLEPGAGIGVFPGLMPAELSPVTTYTGIEYDRITGSILKHLFPDEQVRVESYVDSQLPSNFYDVAIGNPPFAPTQILDDAAYKKFAFPLHDYFFAKTIDKVRPGGVVAFVSSRYTMDKRNDKMRAYLAERADLIGAIRLPQTAFKKNAGTEVVTDVLFLQKREPGQAPGGQPWAGVKDVTVGGHTFGVNEYFVEHPEMVLGTHSSQGSMRSKNEYTVLPNEGQTIDAQFAAAAERLPKDIYRVARGSNGEAATVTYIDFSPKAQKEGNFYIDDNDRLMQRSEGVGRLVPQIKFKKDGPGLRAKDAALVRAFIPLRDALKQAHFDQLNDNPEWEGSLKALGKAYKEFVKAHGNILQFTQTTRNVQNVDEDTGEVELDPETGEPITAARIYRTFPFLDAIRDDPDWTLVAALEKIDEQSGKISQSKFLSERQLNKPSPPEIRSVSDAMLSVLNDFGKLDMDEIASRIGESKAAVIDALGTAIYDDPSAGWVMADAYLSGNVKAKLKDARIAAANDQRYERNVQALLAHQPADVAPGDISANIGMNWIPAQHYVRFLADRGVRVNVSYEPRTKTWHVDAPTATWEKDHDLHKFVFHFKPDETNAATVDWGTLQMPAHKILEHALTGEPIAVTKAQLNADGKWVPVADKDGTALAEQKMAAMQEAFKSWVWTDADRAAELSKIYNERFNTNTSRQFDGRHLTLPGKSLSVKVHDHVKRGAWRIIQDGDTYLAHAVGAGKTWADVIALMEMKRLGTVKKPMVVVPNHMLAQWAAEWLQLYPAARLAVADEKNFTGDKRREFVSRVALSDLDGVIITQSAFKLLDLDPAFKRGLINRELEFYRAALKEAGGDPDKLVFDKDGKRVRGKKEGRVEPNIKRIEQAIESLEQKLAAAMSSAGKDQNIRLDQMGIDHLTVDEAQDFRKLQFVTQRAGKGIDAQGSQRAFDLWMKTRWLAETNPGRSLVMLSGTPITNTLAELFSVQRYMKPQALDEKGLTSFDDWAAMFGEMSSELEADPGGKYTRVSRFAKFNNVPELTQMFRDFADVLTADHLAAIMGDNRPKVLGGTRNIIVTPDIAEHADYKLELAARLATSRKWKPTFEEPNNPDPVIAIIGDGRLASADMRFMRALPSNPDSKLNKLIDQVIKDWQEGKDLEYMGADGQPEKLRGSTQMVFANIGFGAGVAKRRGFDARAWFEKRLRDAGIPPAQVAFMSDYKRSDDKIRLFGRMNRGEVRILVGSDANMGTGVNAQQRLAVLQHLDVPWFPAALTQREGRIIRQGNKNPTVRINAFATGGSYDSVMWQQVARKQRFIDQALSGDVGLRSLEDISESSQMQMAQAMTAANPKAIELAGAQAEVERLMRLSRAHEDSQWKMRADIEEAERRIAYVTRVLPNAEVQAAKVKDLSGDKFSATIGKQAFDKRKDWGTALLSRFSDLSKSFNLEDTKLGEISGFPINYSAKSRYSGNGEMVEFTSWISLQAGDKMEWHSYSADADPVGTAMSIGNALERIRREPAVLRDDMAANRDKINAVQQRVGAPFEFAQMLADKRAEVERLEAEMISEGLPATVNPDVLLLDRRARQAIAAADRQPLDPVMSRGGQGGGVDVAEVRSLVQTVRAGLGNAARIEVEATTDDLPANLLAHVRKHSALADVQAIFDPKTQTIHLVAGNIGSMEEAEAAIFHDLFGHYGLRGIIGDAYTRTMRQIAAHNANVRREASAIRSRYGYGELLAIEEALAERAGAGETVRMIDRVMAALSAGLRRIGLTRMADLIERMTDAEVRVLLGRAREFVRGGNRNANNLVPEMQMAMSRAGQAPANASPQQRADAFLAQQSRRIAPIEAVLSAPFKLTRLDRVLAGGSDRLLQAMGNLVPETVKQGIVSDYKNPQAVVDRRQSMRGAQSRLLRESGDLLNRLATLTRAESRVAYEWMNSQDPQSAEWFRQQLPEESVRVLADIEKLIDRLSKEAVALGQLNPEAFARNRFAYLRRSYVKHTAELDPQEAKARSRAIAVFGEQYKGRGMFEAVPMAKIENIAPAWWKRKLQTGKADTALKGEKFIRLEHRKTVGVGVAPLPGVGPAQQSRLLEVKYFPAGEALPTQYLSWDQAGTWEVRDVKGKDAILWRDFSKEERERMGEIDEVRFAVAKTLHGMIHDVEAGKFLQWIAENHAKKTEADLPQGAIIEQAAESMLRVLNPDAWVQVPDSEIPKSGGVKRYGVLGGRFVPVPVWNDIRQSTGRQRPIGGLLWGAILRAWKVSKALALDTPIPIPSGWTTMGALKPGDTVFDEKGSPCTVLQATETQYNHQCYEVEFSDGTKIVADAGHLWYTIRSSRRGSAKAGIRTTAEILQTLKEPTRGDNQHSIPVAGPLELPHSELRIPPYALGAWLGDGDTRSARISAGGDDADELVHLLDATGVSCGSLTKDSRNNVFYFQLMTPGINGKTDGRRRGESIQAIMRELGLLGRKHIPAEYLRSSEAQRRELLKGLMDTDGNITERGLCSFATSLLELRDGMLELLRSLGYKPSLTKFQPSCNGKPGKTAWRINFKGYADKPVFGLSRKVGRLCQPPVTRQRSQTRQIVAVRDVPSVPVRCILVSSPSHLFLAGNGMVPTHNTALSPAVHMNNVASNIVMADWADVGVLDLTEALSVISKAGKDPAMREILNRFEDAGGKGGTFAVTELQREQLEPLLEALRKEYGTAGQATGMVGINAALGLLFKRQWKAALEAASTSMPARGARAAANAMIDLYQSEDVVFRLAKWIKEKRSGATDEQAAKAARSSFLDYEINAPWIQAMRQSAFPFISFTYRAAPMLLNIVTHKPWKILKLGLAYGALNALGYALSGGDEDKERKLLPEEKAGRLWGVGPPKLVRMGWNDKHDQPVFLDVRRWVPVGDIVDLGQTHGAVPIVPFLVPSGPLALLGELVANKSQFTGKEIVKKDTDTAGEIAAKTLDHIYKSFAPNLPGLPFTYATESLMNAGGGKTDPFGRELSLPQAAASSVGVKLASYPPDVMARQLAGKRIGALRQIQENVGDLTRDYVRKGIDTEEYQDKLARQREKARNVDEEYFKRVR